MKNVTDSLDEIIKLIRELENKIDKVIEKQDDTWTLKDKSKT
jgi:molybdenum-dependent DNA-binding transcriptional regulator ModE